MTGPERPYRSGLRQHRGQTWQQLRAFVVPGLLIGTVLAATIVLAQGNQHIQQPQQGTQVPSATEQLDQAAPQTQELNVAVETAKLLQLRAQGVLNASPQQWRKPLDSHNTTFVTRQTTIFDNLADVQFASWSYQTPQTAEITALKPTRLAELNVTQGWVVPTVLSYQLADQAGKPLAGQTPIRRQQTFTVIRRGEEWSLTDTSDGVTAVDLWDLGKVSVHHSKRALVVGTASTATLQRIGQEMDVAGQRVDEVWGDHWPRTAIVMIPASTGDMARLLSRSSPAGLNQVAAVTTGAVNNDNKNSSTTGDRIIINPGGYNDLGKNGRLIVLTHELTHVATRISTSGSVPIWLSEGFSDYVAYRKSKVQPRFISAAAVKAYKQGRIGDKFPDKESFDPTVADISPAYSGCWMIANLIANEYGPDKLVALYRDLASTSVDEAGVEEALTQHLGISSEELLSKWRAELRAKAG